ncbi:hypothetical protein M5D96_009197, partial [Drosophila gunungcola]
VRFYRNKISKLRQFLCTPISRTGDSASKIFPYGENTQKSSGTPSVIALVKFMTIHTGQHNSVWIFQRAFGSGGLRTSVGGEKGA